MIKFQMTNDKPAVWQVYLARLTFKHSRLVDLFISYFTSDHKETMRSVYKDIDWDLNQF